MIKVLIFIAMATAVAYVAFSKHSLIENNQISDRQLDELNAQKVLQTSGLDANALSVISDKLEQSCDKNKLELTEEECLQAISERKTVCIRLASQRFPESLTSTEQMKWLTAHYENCIFQQ